MLNGLKTIVYIGDFDFENKNVQSHLVKNNAFIFNRLGFRVLFIGINRDINDKSHLKRIELNNNNVYVELPNTLNLKGLFLWKTVYKTIEIELENEKNNASLEYVISYQCPTYSFAIKKIGLWCKRNNIKYIVNCADIPVFYSQPLFKKIVMELNWKFLHKYNKKYSDDFIVVSNYIKNFYSKKNANYLVLPPLFDFTNFQTIKMKQNECTTFVYAGTPFINSKRKIMNKGMKDRLDLIVDLFINLKSCNCIFQIVGISKNDYLNAVPRHKNILNNFKNIVFLNRVNHKEALNIIASSDFSINYRDENKMNLAGFSTKVVESISVGTPVILNQIGEYSFYLEKGISLFELSPIFNNNINLLQQICMLSSSSRLALKRATFEKKTFDINKYVKAVDDFFNGDVQ